MSSLVDNVMTLRVCGEFLFSLPLLLNNKKHFIWTELKQQWLVNALELHIAAVKQLQ